MDVLASFNTACLKHINTRSVAAQLCLFIALHDVHPVIGAYVCVIVCTW